MSAEPSLPGSPEGREVPPACLFCDIVAGTSPAHLVLDEPHVVAFLDIRPLFPGHTLVVPRVHHAVLADLPANLVAPFFEAVQRLTRAVIAGLGADGSLVANNNTVSQSVPHLHVHVVPRRRRDGLRGFLWPRHPYPNDEEAVRTAAALRAAVQPPPA